MNLVCFQSVTLAHKPGKYLAYKNTHKILRIIQVI